MTHEILTPEDVAKYLRIPEIDVERLALERRIPSIQVGPYIRFTREAIERWLGEEVNGHPDAPWMLNASKLYRRVGRNQSHLVENGRCLEIVLENSYTISAYSLVPVQKSVRRFFPGYKVPFAMEADGEVMRTHVTSAPGSAKPGDPLAGHYIRNGLAGWFSRHRKEIKPGVCLRISAIRPHKEYRLEIRNRSRLDQEPVGHEDSPVDRIQKTSTLSDPESCRPRRQRRSPRRVYSGLTGQQLNLEWKVGASHALYHKDGTYYNHLQRFPGALFDRSGYVCFRTQKEYQECPYLQIGKQLHVAGSISSMPGYVRSRKPI